MYYVVMCFGKVKHNSFIIFFCEHEVKCHDVLSDMCQSQGVKSRNIPRGHFVGYVGL